MITSSKIIHTLSKVNMKLAEKFISINNSNSDFSITKNDNVIKLTENGEELFITTIDRLDKYSKGLDSRYQYLKDCYLLNLIDFNKFDTVLDIGANIGEIYKLLKPKEINYIALEPNIDDFNILKKNTDNCVIHNKAAWNKNEKRKFYSLTSPADSSLIPSHPENHHVTVIDAIKIDSLKINGEIKLIKIDCEGAEPEALIGASNTLKNTQYVSVDISNERGSDKKSVKKRVINILKKSSFLVLDEYYSKNRQCIIFKKRTKKKYTKKKGFIVFGQNGWTPKFSNICKYLENLSEDKFSFKGLFISKRNFDEFKKNNKIRNLKDFYLKDEIINSYKSFNPNLDDIEIYEKSLNISLWKIILSERRYTDNLFQRKFTSKSLNHNELKLHMYAMLHFFFQKLKDVDFVLLTKPSSAWSYALCLVAQKLKKQICVIDQVGQPNHRCTITSTPFQNWSEVNEVFLKKDFKYKELSKKFVSDFRKKQQTPPWLIQGKKNFTLSKYLSRYKVLIFLNEFSYEKLKDRILILFQFFIYRFRKFLIQNFSFIDLENINKDEKYIYFPLHVEPESSLMIDGPKGLDQFALIQKISLQLPINWKVYVKEHPNMIGWRSFTFYEKLKKIKNLKLINFNEQNYELIRHSQSLLVISGTTGWEGLLLKKPVIAIGNSFYQKLPMVYKLENLDKFDNALNWLKKEYIHRESLLHNFISSIYSASINVPYDYYWGIGDELDTWIKINKMNKYSYRLSKQIISFLYK